MGGFQQEETHDSPSSSMTYALRWRHEYLSKISLAAIISIAITLMILLLVSFQARKQVYLVVDGQVKAVETSRAILQEMLDEEAIVLKPEDQVSMPLNGSLVDGDKIVISRAVKIQVTADGRTKTRFTTKSTVNGAMNELGLSLESDDKIFPSLTSSVTDNMNIKIVRINKQTVQRTEKVPFRTIKTADATVLKGNIKVVQKGQTGTIIQNIEKIYQDGKLVSMRMVGKEVQAKTQHKVIAVGTKVEAPKVVVAQAKVNSKSSITKVSSNNQVSKAGVDFTYKKMLNNVSMTAYSSQEPGIGTRTASGTRVTEGRTIAVDPDVIPLGWWVYIEGMGFRRAEDTGGAINGNKIDMYFDSLQNARNFGRKSGRTVYVIGPVKPELN